MGEVSTGHGGPLRLTTRGRVVFALLAFLMAGGLGWGGKIAFAASESTPTQVRVHTVAAGDTLWGYARVAAGSGQDVRDVVADIVDLNGLESGRLTVGQRILLPVE